jgi:hypothetical protein
MYCAYVRLVSFALLSGLPLARYRAINRLDLLRRDEQSTCGHRRPRFITEGGFLGASTGGQTISKCQGGPVFCHFDVDGGERGMATIGVDWRNDVAKEKKLICRGLEWVEGTRGWAINLGVMQAGQWTMGASDGWPGGTAACNVMLQEGRSCP